MESSKVNIGKMAWTGLSCGCGAKVIHRGQLARYFLWTGGPGQLKATSGDEADSLQAVERRQ